LANWPESINSVVTYKGIDQFGELTDSMLQTGYYMN
jgi:hypothetical protein